MYASPSRRILNRPTDRHETAFLVDRVAGEPRWVAHHWCWARDHSGDCGGGLERSSVTIAVGTEEEPPNRAVCLSRQNVCMIEFRRGTTMRRSRALTRKAFFVDPRA